MGSGEGDAIKWVPNNKNIELRNGKKVVPVVGKVEFQGRVGTISPEKHDPFTTYTIPPKDRQIIIDALYAVVGRSRYEHEVNDAIKIIKYLGG